MDTHAIQNETVCRPAPRHAGALFPRLRRQREVLQPTAVSAEIAVSRDAFV